MASSEPLNIAIVGGSLAGLSTALVLSHKNPNHKITILERAPSSQLQNQGAGIVAGPAVQNLFSTYDITKTPITVTSNTRQYLNRKGEVIDSKEQVQKMTSWDLLYNVLRRCTDGGGKDEYFLHGEGQGRAKELKGKGRGNVKYFYGCKVIDLQPTPPTTYSPNNYPTSQTTIIYTNSEGKENRLSVDIVIAADGPSSTIRTILYPHIKRTYAGYVAWRGTIPETSVSPETLECFRNKFTFFHSHNPNTQILAYLIPGPNGTTTPTHRLINYVWYQNYPSLSPELVSLMTDTENKSHEWTLPAGKIQPPIWENQKLFAEKVLPRQFAEIVKRTETPFVQKVTDLLCGERVVEEKGGRFGGWVVLVGDAVAGFRPHTAGSTGQAAWQAVELGKVGIFGGDGDEVMALGEWERRVLEWARERQGQGVEMGVRNQFGRHPLAVDEYDDFANEVKNK